MNTNDMTRFEKCRHCMPDLSNKRVTFMCTKRNEEANEEIGQKGADLSWQEIIQRLSFYPETKIGYSVWRYSNR